VALNDIDHIIVVVLENRSFDHMLGYLSLPGGPCPEVEGLRADQGGAPAFANAHAGRTFSPVRLAAEVQAIADPDHARGSIAVQVGARTPAGAPMGGFVESYATRTVPAPPDPSLAMGYYDAEAVPVFDFFARNFTVCDHWFSALPASTQINRFMLMAGMSPIADNVRGPARNVFNVYDWLERKQVPWCVYKEGAPLPFFALDPERTLAMLESMALGGPFRRFSRFDAMWRSDDPAPAVIYIEPEYSEGPRVGPPCDDHCPTGVAAGQAFLGRIYNTLIANPARWARTLMIVTYDEHGGFFDHVEPLPIPDTAGGVAFATTGVRVPALLVSPQVAAGAVFKGPLDHTSVLQLLDDRFSPGEGYSVQVNARQAHLDRILNALSASPAAPRAPGIPQEVLDRLDAAAQAAAEAAAQTFPPITGASPTDPANAQALREAALRAAGQGPRILDHPQLADLKAYLQQAA
jgi:phospholipase C